MSKILNKGFSLIELIITLSLSSLVTIITLKSYNQFSKFRDRFELILEENYQWSRIHLFFKKLSIEANYGYFRPLSDYRLSSEGAIRYGIYSYDLLPNYWLKKKPVSDLLIIAFIDQKEVWHKGAYLSPSKQFFTYAILDPTQGEHLITNAFSFPHEVLNKYPHSATRIVKIHEKAIFLSFPSRPSKYPSLYLVEDYQPKKELLANVKSLAFRFGTAPQHLVEKNGVTDWDLIKYLEINIELPHRSCRWILSLPNK